MKSKNLSSALYVTRGAIVAAMYVALTYLASMLGLSSGVIWTVPNIIWTAVFSVLVGACIVYIFIKKDFSDIYENLNLNRIPE